MGPGKFEMFPEQTEQRLHLTLADARHQIEVKLERKPSGIWNEDLYTSVPDSALLINMKFNAMEERVSFSVAINTQASLDSVYLRSSQNSQPNSDTPDMNSRKERGSVFRIARGDPPPAF